MSTEPRVGPPPPAGESTYEAPAEGLAEVLIVGRPNAVVKPQKYWRDQSKPEGQFEWNLVIREGADAEQDDKGKTMKFWTGNSVGAHPKNKLVKVLKAVDPNFVLDKAYDTLEDFYKAVEGKPMRIIITHVTKPDKEDPTIPVTFGQVSDTFLKTLKPELDIAEQLMAIGAQETGVTENVLERDLG